MRKNSLTADFETTVDETKTRVWAWGIASIETGEMIEYGNDIKTFMNYIFNKNVDIYFHNLKFDGVFIINHLLRHGIKHSRNGEPLTFNTLITDTGEYFMIEIIWKRYNKKVVKTVFLDSFKKLPFSVDRIAQTFNLPIEKLEIDYKAPRPEGYILTDDEIDYLKNDVEIMAQALKIMFDEGLEKMTIASDALWYFKNMITKKGFEHLFPVLDNGIDADIRRSYKGGFTYLNPKFASQIVNGIVFDVNSLYPAMMYNKPMPWGVPIYYRGNYNQHPMYPLYIQRINCQFKIKEDYIPTLQLKGNLRFVPTQYVESSAGEDVELVLTSVDLELFFEHYEVTMIEYIDGYMFKSSTEIFKPYIDHWGHIKENSTGARRQQAKLMLNSLYGKFASNPVKRKKIPTLTEDFKIKYEYEPYEEGESIYTAVSSFITSYARELTIRSAQKLKDRFIYADTDSLHLVGNEHPTNIEVHPTRIGAWAFEDEFTKGKYLRAKSYILEVDGKVKVTVAGMPSRMHHQVNFNNFDLGVTYPGKLTQRQVDGGLVLIESDFTIHK